MNTENNGSKGAKPGHVLFVGAVLVIFFAILFWHSTAVAQPRLEIFDNPILLGDLSKDEVRTEVATHKDMLRSCLSEDPNLVGKVVVKFIISRDGGVSSSSVNSTTLEDTEIEACLVDAFRQMSFPAPHNGGIVIVTQPLIIGNYEIPPIPELAPTLRGPPTGQTIEDWDLGAQDRWDEIHGRSTDDNEDEEE